MTGGAVIASIGRPYWVTTGQYWQSTDDAYVGGNVTDLAPKVSGLIARTQVRALCAELKRESPSS